MITHKMISSGANQNGLCSEAHYYYLNNSCAKLCLICVKKLT